MIQKWEIYNWCTNQRVQLCSSESVAQRLLPSHGKNHLMREIYFYDDGELAKVHSSWKIGAYEHKEKDV